MAAVLLGVACLLALSGRGMSIRSSSAESVLSKVVKLNMDSSVLEPIPVYDKAHINSLLSEADHLTAPAAVKDDLGSSALLLEVEEDLAHSQGRSLSHEGSEGSGEKKGTMEEMATKAAGKKPLMADPLTEKSARVDNARPEDQLPNMSPLDGLDDKLLNPLENPRHFNGPNQFLKDYPDKASLPSIGQILDFSKSGGVVGSKSKLTPGSVLPPLINSAEVGPVPDSLSKEFGDLSLDAKAPVPSAGAPPTWHDDAIGASPWIGHASEDPLTRTPYVVGSPYINKDYHPVVAVPTTASYGAFSVPSVPPMYPSGGHLGPQTPEFHAYVSEKKSLETQRERALAALNKRKAQINYLQSYVDGGEAWVNKMQDQWNRWIEAERAKGAKSIEAEQRKVDTFKAQLKTLTDAQKEDQERVNMFNGEIRKSQYNYEIKQRQAKLKEAQEKQKKLQEELERSNKGKEDLEKDIAEYSAKLGGGSGSTEESASL